MMSLLLCTSLQAVLQMLANANDAIDVVVDDVVCQDDKMVVSLSSFRWMFVLQNA